MIKRQMEHNSIWKYDNAHTQVSKNMQGMDINIINIKFPVQIQENLKEHQLTQKYADYNQKPKQICSPLNILNLETKLRQTLDFIYRIF